MKVGKIHELSKYQDWLEKAKHELKRYEETRDIFDLANVFLTLNALPEWIEKTDDVAEGLRALATDKIRIMKSQSLNESELHDIDNQLRLVRLFCNHAKHGDPKGELTQIIMSAPFPFTFPVNFDHLQVGELHVEVLPILKSLVSFWSAKIERQEQA